MGGRGHRGRACYVAREGFRLLIHGAPSKDFDYKAVVSEEVGE
jgi:hypothetical protein